MQPLELTSHPKLAEQIRAAALQERDLRNEVAGCADKADALADTAIDRQTRSRCRMLAGSLRYAALAS